MPNQTLHGRHIIVSNFVDQISKDKQNNCRFLDIGCHNGELSLFLANKLNAELYGIDIDELVISNIKNKKGTFFVMNVEELDFSEDMFDVIIALDSIHFYTIDIKKALKNIYQVGKKESYFILSLPCSNELKFLSLAWWLKVYKFYTCDEISRLLISHGFEVLQIKRKGIFYHPIIILVTSLFKNLNVDIPLFIKNLLNLILKMDDKIDFGIWQIVVLSRKKSKTDR